METELGPLRERLKWPSFEECAQLRSLKAAQETDATGILPDGNALRFQLPRRDPVAPVQTLPSPTREAKAEAAALMRTAERVWMLRGSV